MKQGNPLLGTDIASLGSKSSRLAIAAFPVCTCVWTIAIEGKTPMSQRFAVNR